MFFSLFIVNSVNNLATNSRHDLLGFLSKDVFLSSDDQQLAGQR